MATEWLTAKEAAHRLRMAVTTLYSWLGLSDRGLLIVRGLPTTIDYLQGGGRGQGRILLDSREVERLQELMRVKSQPSLLRQSPSPRPGVFPGITVALGRPD
jgi:hypothetical protein